MKIDPSLRYGIVAGVGAVAYFLLFYFVNKPLFFSPWVWWSSLLIYIWAMTTVARPEGGPDLKRGLSRSFTVFVIGNAIFFLFYYLMMVEIDPQLVALQKELLISHPMYDGNPKEMDIDLTPGKIFFNYSYSLIGGFLLAFVIAGLLNRK